MAWPRHILDRIIHENLDYIRPRATHKQETLIRELENMLTVPTFEEQWPDEHEDNFFKGRKWQRRIAEMRPEEATTIEDVYKLDSELYDWWMRTDYKDNQR
jgi:hypothetical protein